MPDKATGKARVACLLSGNGTTMSALLFASKLPGCPYEIVLVASNVPDAPGLHIAAAEGIATFAQDHRGMEREAHEAVMDAALRASGAQYLALCGYMRILTPGFVSGWESCMVNTHPSLLPKYKGLDTHQRAIEAGEKFGGCSVHVVTAELDGGQPTISSGLKKKAISIAAFSSESEPWHGVFARSTFGQFLADRALRRRRPGWSRP
jgi:phosphoribosylglycinamide formyltransferase 1